MSVLESFFFQKKKFVHLTQSLKTALLRHNWHTKTARVKCMIWLVFIYVRSPEIPLHLYLKLISIYNILLHVFNVCLKLNEFTHFSLLRLAVFLSLPHPSTCSSFLISFVTGLSILLKNEFFTFLILFIIYLCSTFWLLFLGFICFIKKFLGGCFSSVQLLSRVWLFATPWTAAHQASLSITNSRSLLKLMSIASVMPSRHLILCCPLLLPPSIFPSIRWLLR